MLATKITVLITLGLFCTWQAVGQTTVKVMPLGDSITGSPVFLIPS